ncbi:MAG: NACHT domain-containing protein [Symploca sp. SIO3C6]|uniref:NACHT domain-containing protein n=1 Tax=Symploca sp. SIO1C4 TaxID=2607765 RepID=A0A6B3N622_9CYAN|nr:NACHT domain-containing protein [Symploca sp. SIO3C6]NER27030.1 NACHT domain-containing protein [Symploca sp. SIO1C4]
MDIEEALALANALVFAESGEHLSDLQQALLRESWSWQRLSYEKIAENYGYSPTYLKHDVGPKLWKLLSKSLGEKVSKTNFRAAIERRHSLVTSALPAGSSSQLQTVNSNTTKSQVAELIDSQLVSTSRCQDWGESSDVSVFYGRQQELEQLQQWMVADNCRLLALLGMAGIGKTSLSVKLAQQLQEQFEFVIWRSLRYAPSLEELLVDIIALLSNEQQTNPIIDLHSQLAQLLDSLRRHRCLLVLDAWEALLQPGKLTGSYRQGYEGYGDLLKQLGELPHSSCLVITSREKPREIALLEGGNRPVRSLELKGLGTAALEILREHNLSDQAYWKDFCLAWRGNPLALKIVSVTIQDFFGGSVSNFLKNSMFLGDFEYLLFEQFERLSELEKKVVYCLAIAQKPISCSQLLEATQLTSISQILKPLESLARRFLIEQVKEGKETMFTLPPVVMKYALKQDRDQE